MPDFFLNSIKLFKHLSIALKCWQQLLILIFVGMFFLSDFFSKYISLILKFDGFFMEIIWKEVVLVFINGFNVVFRKSSICPGQLLVNQNVLIDERLKFWLVKIFAVWGHVECVFFNV